MRETTPPTEVEMNELCRELYYCKSAYTLMRQRMALLYSLTPPRLPNKYSYDFIHCPRGSGATLIALSNPLYSFCAPQILQIQSR